MAKMFGEALEYAEANSLWKYEGRMDLVMIQFSFLNPAMVEHMLR
jgi:hypothetical protein